MTEPEAAAASPEGAIAHVELRDARIANIVLNVDGACSINLSHLAVYHETAPATYDVWSYEAAIHCRGVVELELSGIIGAEDLVTEATLVGEGGQPLALAQLLEEGRAGSMALAFGSGTGLVMHLTHLLLSLVQPLEKLQALSGPLEQ